MPPRLAQGTFSRAEGAATELLEQLAQALGDRYRVERELGQGGMAIVFLAEDLKHHRRVAVKVLKPELVQALGSERFLREIAIAATLQHPHILPLYDSGEAAGLFYYVMPFVEGESLDHRLSREQQLPLDEALRIAREAGSGLHYAHEHGVVHRDIKPENILLSGGHAVIADFGIARALVAASAEQELTVTGMMLGTPQYMSPEQAGGGAVDGRSDQYSLACTLYEMLIGEPPFRGPNTHAILARHSLETVPGLRVVRPNVPEGVESAIRRAMGKLPADRFSTMQDFVDALVAGAASTSTSAPALPTSAPASIPRRSQARAALTVAIAALVLAAVAGGWLLLRRNAGGPLGGKTISSVAVLPFENQTSGADSSFLGEGMTDGLIADLAGVGSLKIISRGSGTAAQSRARSLADVATELGVGAIVQGSIRRTADSVQVSLRCVAVPDSVVLLTRTYGARIGELPELQRKITFDVARAIHAKVADPERTRLGARKEVNQRAYETYLRGRFHFERDELDQAHALFEEATRIAPDWAPPYVGLANYYAALPFASDLPPAEVLPRARAALERALDLDPALAEAHTANAYIRAYYEWDWRAAEQEFRRALELRPSYADAYFSYSRFLASRRRLDEAIAQIERAVELDPLAQGLPANRALLEYFAGRYEEAAQRLRQIVERDSTDTVARWGLALVVEQQGRPAEAATMIERIGGRSLNLKASLGHAYGVAGKVDKARAILGLLQAAAEKSYVPSYYFALLHESLGERDQALRDLERAYEERSTVLAYLLLDPRLAPLRKDARFVALAGRMGAQQ